MKLILPKTILQVFLTVVFGLSFMGISAQTSINNETPVVQNFNGMGATNSASLPANWRMSPAGAAAPTWNAAGNFTAINQAANSGSPNSGGRYNWGNGTTTTDRAIGFMASGSYANPNSIMAFYQNNTGGQIDDFDFSFDYERYRINTAACSITFFTSTDGTTWTARIAGDSGAFATGANAYNFTTGTVVNKSFTLEGLNIPNGGSLYLRWNFNTTGSNSQGIGLDNVSVTALLPSPSVETLAASNITNAGATLNGVVNANELTASVSFDYGTSIAYGSTVTGDPSELSSNIDEEVTGEISGLSANTLYHFRAVATADGTPTNGDDLTFYTLANVPNAPVVNNATINSLDVAIDNTTNSNPVETLYAIYESTQNSYIQADGSLGASPVYQTAAVWGTITVTGLSSDLEYTFSVAAQNGAAVTTENGTSTSAFTLENLSSNVAIVSPLADFGSWCLNASAITSFIFNGNNLNGSDVTIGPLTGYAFSDNENGPFSASINISYDGNSFSNFEVFVQFTPTVVGTYDGQILINGGGLTVNTNSVSATASGKNDPVVAETGSASNATAVSADLAGNATQGCSAIQAYGVEYSTVNGFTNGSGTQAAGSNLSEGSFSVNISGLNANTAYYYKVYAIDATGTVYGDQSSFTTAGLEAPEATDASDIQSTSFVANWEAVPGATSYRLDVSTQPDFSTTTNATDLIISEYVEGSSNNKYVEIYNGTGAAVSLNNYQLILYANGASSPTNTNTLSGTLANGAVVVYRNTSTGYTGPSTEVSATNFNGDDAIGLYKISTSSYVDIFGSIGSDPGTMWSTGSLQTVDRTLVRRPEVLTGVTTSPASGFPTLGTEWIQSPIDTFTSLGSHTMATVNPSFVGIYEDLTVNGTSQLVEGLNEGATYYYRVRAVSANSTSPSSNIIEVETAVAPPTFGAISQFGSACEGEDAVFSITGLLPSSSSTITYNIGNGTPVSIEVEANLSGFVQIYIPVTILNNGQVLTVTAVERTGTDAQILEPTENNQVSIVVNALGVYYADTDSDGFGDAAAEFLTCELNPSGYVTNNTDCDDSDGAIWQTGTLFVDFDNDGYTTGDTEEVCYGDDAPDGYALANIGIDCDDEIGAVNPGAAEIPYNGVDDNCDGTIDEGSQVFSRVVPNQCGTTLTSIGSLVGLVSVPAATRYRIEVTNVDTEVVHVIERAQPNFSIVAVPDYDYAATYAVRVMVQRNNIWLNYYGISCQIGTPAVLGSNGAAQINPSLCDVTLSKINTLIATTSLPGVIAYRFQITNLTDSEGPNRVQTIDRPLHWFSLQMLARYNYGTTYSVEVAVKTNETNGFSGFGAPCVINSPAVDPVGQCGAVIPSGTARVSSASLNGVTSYRFTLINTATLQVTTLDRPYNYFIFNQIPDYSPGTDYGVTVEVMTTGIYSPPSEGCTITSPGAARENVKESTPAFAAVAYPNPFADSFRINVSTVAEQDIEVKVYDMTGRMLEATKVHATGMDTLEVGARYPAGVYNVIVSQGEEVRTLRVIKR